MKSSLLFLFTITGLAHATPPVLSLTQAELRRIDSNSNAATKPTCRIRQIQYNLHQGEAGWLPEPNQAVNF